MVHYADSQNAIPVIKDYINSNYSFNLSTESMSRLHAIVYSCVDASNKNLTTKLRKLKTFILDNLDDPKNKSKDELGDWLSYNIDLFFKRITDTEQSELVTDNIQIIMLLNWRQFLRRRKGRLLIQEIRPVV